MKKNLTPLLVTIALLLAAAAPALPQGNGNGFLMLEEPTSPRSTAMGSVGTALGDAYGFRYYNPAQPFLSRSLSSYASAEFGQMPGGVNRGGIETAMLFPDFWSAVSFFSSSVGFETRDERGFGANASSATTVGALSVGYIYGNAAAGVALSMVEDRIWIEDSYSAVAISLGLGYKALSDKLTLGAALLHFGAWSRGFEDNASLWHGGRVPVYARAGAAWTDTLLSVPYTVAADVVYRDEDGTLSAPVGIEVSVLPYVNLRIGKRIGWENEVLSLGIGLNIDRISFDAAFVPTVFVDDYEMKWSMGFTYSMGFRRKGGSGRGVVIEEPILIKGSATGEDGDDDAVSADDEAVSTEEAVLTDGDNAVPTEDGGLTDGEAVSTEEAVLTDDEAVSTEDEAVSTEE